MEPTDPFQNLPDEMILEIFTHLDRNELAEISEVSQKMNQIASDDSLLKNAFSKFFKKVDITRVHNLRAADPEITDKELTKKIIESVKDDCKRYKISTPVSLSNIDSIEKEINDARLVEFADILVTKGVLNLTLTDEQSTAEKAKTVQEYLSDPKNTQNVTKLDLYSSNLKIVPEQIGLMTNLKHLDLSNTQIDRLPDSIGKLTNLKVLVLMNTQLKTLPESIGQLNKLEGLRLDNSSIKSLPKSLEKVPYFKALGICGLTLDKDSKDMIRRMKGSNRIKKLFT